MQTVTGHNFFKVLKVVYIKNKIFCNSDLLKQDFGNKIITFIYQKLALSFSKASLEQTALQTNPRCMSVSYQLASLFDSLGSLWWDSIFSFWQVTWWSLQ